MTTTKHHDAFHHNHRSVKVAEATITNNNNVNNDARTSSERMTNDVNNETTLYNFAFIPKSTENPFFQSAIEGCIARAEELSSVTCWASFGPEKEEGNGARQAQIIHDIIKSNLQIKMGNYTTNNTNTSNSTIIDNINNNNNIAPVKIDGIAISVSNGTSIQEPIQMAIDTGISVITFDSDANESSRQAYVGTNNVALGIELGKVLLKLRPDGGTYAIVSLPIPNLIERVEGVRQELDDSTWVELETNGSLTERFFGPQEALEEMAKLKDANSDELDAFIPVVGGLMRNVEGWENFVDSYRNMTFVVADSHPTQIDLLQRGYADGLVGQVPYQIGELVIDQLLEIRKSTEMDNNNNSSNRGYVVEDQVFATNLLEVLRIPLVLPPNYVDHNYIGSLSILGYVFCGIILVLSIIFAGWTFNHRSYRVIKASQPIFLVMIAAGTLIMGATIIPLSMDDEKFSDRACDIACMATPWLISIGFVTTFSALMAKTWRINKILLNPNRFQRVKVTASDVMKPFVILLTINVLMLILWTVMSPLKFVRQPHSGTDPWNRVISTYGVCMSNDGSTPYISTISVINFLALLLANIQAYRARNIHTDYSESRYIAITMASILQAVLLGIPILFLVEEEPRINYIVRVFLVFVVCMAILLLIFIPKFTSLRQSKRREKESGQNNNTSDNDASSSLSSTQQQPPRHPFRDSGTDGLNVKVTKIKYTDSEALHVSVNETTTACSTNDDVVDDGTEGLKVKVLSSTNETAKEGEVRDPRDKFFIKSPSAA